VSGGGPPARRRTLNPRERFTQLVEQLDAEIDLAEAALWIAAEEYPGLDVGGWLARLAALAAEAAPSVHAGADDASRVARLNRFLFVEQGFRGNRDDYYDPRNSFLNDVLERRTGIPIALSLVYIAVGRRLGLDVRGIAFPGHFLVKHVGPTGEIVIDPFARTLLDRDACQRRLDAALPKPERLRPERHLRHASAREILARVLGNLKRIFAARSDLERTLACCDRILLLWPNLPEELRDRALVYESMACYAAAAADLDTLLEVAPQIEGAAALRTRRDALRAKRGMVH
jgi:regulator of sirC expression with transglutaminase-like and TPR domain